MPNQELVALGVPLAGRERELSVGLGCLDAALKGTPQVLVLLGEPGIGKTSLAQATLDIARRRGAATAIGTAVDDETAPPYWPWRQVFRRLAARSRLRAAAESLGLAAELGAIAPDLFGSARAEGDQFSHLDAAALLLRGVAESTPLAFVLDDLQWADDDTLRLLRHLAGALTDERILIVIAARDTEGGHGRLVADLSHRAAVTTLRLRGLDAGGVRAQLSALMRRAVGGDEVDQVLSLTGGNPFLVREVGRQIHEQPLVGGDPVVTPSVGAAVDRRLARLDGGAVTLLEAAAVIGLEFRADVLAEMSASTLEEALADLDVLRAAGLVEPLDGGSWRFQHALVRDAVEARVGSARRIALHESAAEALGREAADSGAATFEIARHWLAASAGRPSARAASALEAAARGAIRQRGHDTAARLYRQALSAGGSQLPGDVRATLWLGVAHAAAPAGDHEARFEACQHAAELARRAQRPDLLALAALAMSSQGPDATRRATRDTCDEALALLATDDLALRARLVAHRAETYLYTVELQEFEPATLEALDLARQSGDADALEAALRVRQFVLGSPAHLDQRAELARVMVTEGERLGRPLLVMQGHFAGLDVELERGRLTGAAAEIEALERLSAMLHHRFGTFAALQARAVLAIARGQFEAGRESLSKALAVFRAGGDRNPYLMRSAMLSNLSHHAGVDAATLTAIEEARAAHSGEDAGLIAAVSDASVLAAAGRTDEARDLYDACGPVQQWRPPAHVELLAVALGIAVARHLGRDRDLAVLRKLLATYAGHHVVCGTGAIAYYGPVELWTGIAAAAVGRFDESMADLEVAAERARASGAPGFQAEAQIELAAALLARADAGDVPRARKLLSSSEAVSTRLGARALVERADALNRRLGPDPARLTRREEEIARLVAEGLANRAIAQQLFLSERTVQNHVQHVLDKLDLRNRAQIAAWVAGRKDE